MNIEFCSRQIFEIWSLWSPTQNLDPISLAVLQFSGYKQTDPQADKQSIYILSF